MSDVSENSNIQLNKVRNQVLATLTGDFIRDYKAFFIKYKLLHKIILIFIRLGNLVVVGYGMIVGWLAPALVKLASNETPLLSGPLTNREMSWIAAILCIGALLGSFCFGYIISLVGSKRAVLLLSVPCLAFWLLIYFGNRNYHIFIARFIGGCTGGATQLTLVIFVSEISNDNIRGSLASMTSLARNLGTLFGYVLGATVQYEYIPFISAVIPIIFIVFFTMVPNSPRYYIRKRKIQKAEAALKFYKGCNGKTPYENDAIHIELERLILVEREQKTQEKLHVSDFCNRFAIKKLCTGIALVIFSHSTAQFTLANYATIIFKRADSSILTPKMSSILLAVALICGSLTTTTLADILGRKILILISLGGSAFGLFTMAIYDFLKLNDYDLSSFTWIPILSLSFCIFIASAGIVPLAIICSVEYLPPKIRNMGTAFILFTSNFILFGFLKLFPPLMDVIELYGCMLICGILCIVGTIFVAIFLEETSGQCLDEVGKVEQTNDEGAQMEYSTQC